MQVVVCLVGLDEGTREGPGLGWGEREEQCRRTGADGEGRRWQAVLGWLPERRCRRNSVQNMIFCDAERADDSGTAQGAGGRDSFLPLLEGQVPPFSQNKQQTTSHVSVFVSLVVVTGIPTAHSPVGKSVSFQGGACPFVHTGVGYLAHFTRRRLPDSLGPPVNVSIRDLKANSAVVTWDIPDAEPVIGFAITQQSKVTWEDLVMVTPVPLPKQKKDVRMLRFIQEVNTTTRSCVLWDLEADTDYIVHVQSVSVDGTSPPSDPLRFRTAKEAERQASKSKDEVTMEEVGQTTQLRAGELIIIVVVLIMWAGVIALFCRQYDIIKDNEPNNNKDKAKNSSECSTPEHPTGGLLRSKV
ncbi:hypothetical protein P4O66_013256 [Electrophorus voltai]|uniref:Fibronectin type-III domain-containing protein n=2 Tax=Electrophorus TaxID=8004 RepID=A0AAD8Z2K0_9TELE|nr:hypothetical protein P4O66_013256 [Electrophorus voltai]